ncbi:S1C family serine protease [Neorhodopirellula pilleata]|uniref:Putative serine protease HtrA n=1 Tax=Neorhodopirellula pilleata TaxID=2714738 RepID=A0A5C6AUL3_9BACT|nr:putative serine protease HtrA [Neorhodopirellula pilleata]
MLDDVPPNPDDAADAIESGTCDRSLSVRQEISRSRQLAATRITVPTPTNGPMISTDVLRDATEQDVGVDAPNADFESVAVASDEPLDPPQDESVREAASPPVATTSHHPILQSVMLLMSMLVMLAVARYSVPSIVEEIRYAWHRGELRAEYESGTEGLRNVSLDSLSRAYQMVTSAVGPSVVHIDVQRRATDKEKQMHQMLGGGMFSLSDQGSGVVVDSEGYVLTNRHVIVDGEEISVTLSDGRRLKAQVIGTDSLTDLAVLKIDADRLMPIQWGDSDKLRVGSPVWAVGSPFGLDRTITFGILSGKHRMVRAGERHGSSFHYQDFMQSDVAVNPGNSGGPLVDAKGTLVGINTAIVGDTYQGVSFSIPSNLSREIYQRIRETGRVQRGYLGVSLQEVPDDLLIGENTRVRGALVTGLANDGSPAASAGMLAGDIVRKANDEDVIDVGHLMRIVGKANAGTPVRLQIRRNDADLELTVTLGDRPVELDP